MATHCVARYNWDKKLPVLFHSKLDGRDLEWKAEIEKVKRERERERAREGSM